jgi:hypothetical protein
MMYKVYCSECLYNDFTEKDSCLYYSANGPVECAEKNRHNNCQSFKPDWPWYKKLDSVWE